MKYTKDYIFWIFLGIFSLYSFTFVYKIFYMFPENKIKTKINEVVKINRICFDQNNVTECYSVNEKIYFIRLLEEDKHLILEIK